jgi:hypothetical protein
VSKNTREIQRAFILWVHGMRLDDVRDLAEVKSLMEQGVLVELDPAPITGPQAQYYQLLSGHLPARFGFFDTLMPLCHLPYQWKGTDGYNIVEKFTGMDAEPKSLPNLLHAAGWETAYVEITLTGLVACTQRLTQSLSDHASKIVKCTLAGDGQLNASPEASSAAEVIGEALRVARAWVGETGMLGLLADSQPAAVQGFLNINNFLAEMGLIERSAGSNTIDWTNSLAYYAGHGQLWINLMGREPQGAVHPQEEYEEVRDTLIKALPVKLRDPRTGAPVIERVYRKEEIYPEQYLFCAPDLVILFKPGYAPSPRSAHLGFDETTFTVPAAGTVVMAGAHPSVLKGFLLASAPPLIAGVSLPEPVPLISVVPSLLHALGVQDTDTDSAALDHLFKPSYLESHPISERRSEELSEEDEQLIIDRLRDLGYV